MLPLAFDRSQLRRAIPCTQQVPCLRPGAVAEPLARRERSASGDVVPGIRTGASSPPDTAVAPHPGSATWHDSGWRDSAFRRLGGVQERGVDLRLISATHRNLAELVQEGRFRTGEGARRVTQRAVREISRHDSDLGRAKSDWPRQPCGRGPSASSTSRTLRASADAV
jgi:hypothetical protein